MKLWCILLLPTLYSLICPPCLEGGVNIKEEQCCAQSVNVDFDCPDDDSSDDTHHCNPFSQCNCCSIAFSYAEQAIALATISFETFKPSYFESPTLPTIVLSVWRPPKVA